MRKHVRVAAVGLATASIAAFPSPPALATDHADPIWGLQLTRTTQDNRHSSKAATQDLAAPSGSAAGVVPVDRLQGVDRIATAISVAQAAYDDAGSASGFVAKAVVLTRSDDYADALGGSALASAARGPLLLTPTASLGTGVENEIKRLLGSSGTVYLLGGAGAVSAGIEQRLATLGFTVTRLAGLDRFDTSVEIARETDKLNGGTPQFVFATTGLNYPDGLAAGATAGSYAASVVLTMDSTITASVQAYLNEKALATVPLIAVGGPSASAPGSWTAVIDGLDRFDTAAQVATAFWGSPNDPSDDATEIGLATGLNWPDALAGGAYMGGLGPLVLTRPTDLPAFTWNALHGIAVFQAPSTITHGWVFGGSDVVNDVVMEGFNLVLDLNRP